MIQVDNGPTIANLNNLSYRRTLVPFSEPFDVLAHWQGSPLGKHGERNLEASFRLICAEALIWLKLNRCLLPHFHVKQRTFKTPRNHAVAKDDPKRFAGNAFVEHFPRRGRAFVLDFNP